jgi:hypothetical protein
MMRVASLLFVLSLLTSAATAHAECAWVLWVQRVGHSELGPMDAYPTKQDCEAAMSRERERLNRHVDSMLDSPRREAAMKTEREPRHRGPAWAEGQVNGGEHARHPV